MPPLLIAFSLLPFTTGPCAAELAPVEVSGWPFELGQLRDGATAFLNRTYVWENVPPELTG